MTVELRYDDQCKNGHNSFAITGSINTLERGKMSHGDSCIACGCIHDEIAKHFPFQKPLIQWHLFDDTGPMHYIANTLFHLGYCTPIYNYKKEEDAPNLEHARSTAVWPDMPESFICLRDVRMLKVTRDAAAVSIREALEARRPLLIARFHAAMAAIEWDVAEVRT